MPPLWVWAIFASRQHIFSHRQSSAWGRYILPMIKRPLEFTVSVIPVRLYCIKSLCLWNLKTEILSPESRLMTTFAAAAAGGGQQLCLRKWSHTQFEETEQLWWAFFCSQIRMVWVQIAMCDLTNQSQQLCLRKCSHSHRFAETEQSPGQHCIVSREREREREGVDPDRELWPLCQQSAKFTPAAVQQRV